jgi:hypothetical protein
MRNCKVNWVPVHGGVPETRRANALLYFSSRKVADTAMWTSYLVSSAYRLRTSACEVKRWNEKIEICLSDNLATFFALISDYLSH